VPQSLVLGSRVLVNPVNPADPSGALAKVVFAALTATPTNSVKKEVAMTKFTRSAMLAIFISGSVLASGYGVASPASSDPRSSPSVAVRSLGGNVPTTFSNYVSETPWWNKAVNPQQTSAPAALAWTLSGDILFDSGSATLSARHSASCLASSQSRSNTAMQ